MTTNSKPKFTMDLFSIILLIVIVLISGYQIHYASEVKKVENQIEEVKKKTEDLKNQLQYIDSIVSDTVYFEDPYKKLN